MPRRILNTIQQDLDHSFARRGGKNILNDKLQAADMRKWSTDTFCVQMMPFQSGLHSNSYSSGNAIRVLRVPVQGLHCDDS